MLERTPEVIVIRVSLLSAAIAVASAGAQTPRPMTFLDAQNMRQTATPDLSADGKSMLYTLSTPDWNAARRQSDIYLVSTDRGLASTRQLTFTKDKKDRKSTRLNSSHVEISYAVFCLKKKKQ